MEKLREECQQPPISPTQESLYCKVSQFVPIRQDFVYEFTSPSGETFCMDLYALAEQGYGMNNIALGDVISLKLPTNFFPSEILQPEMA